MKKYCFIILGVLLFATSCQENNLINQDLMTEDNEVILEPFIRAYNQYVADDFDLTADLKCAKSDKKIKTKTIVFKRSAGTFIVVPNPGYCAEFSPPFQMVVEGSGIATHLGQFTVLNLGCVSATGSILSPVYGFITAANGSAIHTEMGAPYLDFDNLPNRYYPYKVIGGTGKYAEATGSILMYGFTDPITGDWSFTGEGQISY